MAKRLDLYDYNNWVIRDVANDGREMKLRNAGMLRSQFCRSC
jgi:hypothetical protein